MVRIDNNDGKVNSMNDAGIMDNIDTDIQH